MKGLIWYICHPNSKALAVVTRQNHHGVVQEGADLARQIQDHDGDREGRDEESGPTLPALPEGSRRGVGRTGRAGLAWYLPRGGDLAVRRPCLGRRPRSRRQSSPRAEVRFFDLGLLGEPTVEKLVALFGPEVVEGGASQDRGNVARRNGGEDHRHEGGIAGSGVVEMLSEDRPFPADAEAAAGLFRSGPPKPGTASEC